MVLLRMLTFGLADAGASAAPTAVPAPAASTSRPASGATARPQKVSPVATEWGAIVAALNLHGPVSQLAAHSVLIGRENGKVRLNLDAEGETFRRPALEEKLAQALSAYFGEEVKLEINSVGAATDTPARQQRAAADDRMQNARRSIDEDPNIRAMRDIFGATVQPDSVRPGE